MGNFLISLKVFQVLRSEAPGSKPATVDPSKAERGATGRAPSSLHFNSRNDVFVKIGPLRCWVVSLGFTCMFLRFGSSLAKPFRFALR